MQRLAWTSRSLHDSTGLEIYFLKRTSPDSILSRPSLIQAKRLQNSNCHDLAFRYTVDSCGMYKLDPDAIRYSQKIGRIKRRKTFQANCPSICANSFGLISSLLLPVTVHSTPLLS